MSIKYIVMVIALIVIMGLYIQWTNKQDLKRFERYYCLDYQDEGVLCDREE